MRCDDRSHQGTEKLDITDANVAARYFLDNNAGRNAIETGRTKLFGQVGADQTQFAHLPDERTVDLSVDLARPVAGRKPLTRKSCRGVANGFLVGRECKVQDATYFICLRNSGLRFSLSALTPSFDSAEL